MSAIHHMYAGMAVYQLSYGEKYTAYRENHVLSACDLQLQLTYRKILHKKCLNIQMLKLIAS